MSLGYMATLAAADSPGQAERERIGRLLARRKAFATQTPTPPEARRRAPDAPLPDWTREDVETWDAARDARRYGGALKAIGIGLAGLAAVWLGVKAAKALRARGRRR